MIAAARSRSRTNPNSSPGYAQNETRSIKPEISVLVGVCTHLGCAPLNSCRK
jgi:ubiquinol-cytochrome c reductase iron-sulfur subunit